MCKFYQTLGLFAVFTKTGFVFYGGFLGGLCALYFFSVIYKQVFKTCFLYVLSVTPLIHSIGRVGCFFSGCCYGIRYTGLFSIYMYKAQRFPVQLFEAILLMILFIILQILLLKKQKFIIAVYLLGYGTIRLICEFLRGDMSRGFIGTLSISAWSSLLCIVIGIFFIKKELKSN